MRPSTLRGRLAVVGLLTVAAWVAILTVAFNMLLSHQLRGQVDEVLRTRAQAAAATVDVRPDGTLAVREPTDDEALDTGIWIFHDSRLVEPDSRATSLRKAASALAGRGETFDERRQAPATRLYALPLLNGHKQVGTVVAATSLDPYQRTARLALMGSIALAALLLVGVFVMARWTVTRALAPVHRMARQAADWSATDVTQRFGTTDRPDELAALASSLDGLLDRLSAVLRHEQQLSAELSHELRTPLAHLSAEAELLVGRERSPEELARAHLAIRDSAERMARIIETMLLTARAETLTPPGTCQADEVLASIINQRLSKAGTPRVVLSPQGSRIACGVSPDVLERVVSPVFDNAVRYARQKVEVYVRRADGLVEIMIRDDGPGLPEEATEAAFTPGWRVDPDDGHDGAGLGLALARRLARASGGSVHHEPTGSGATFAVRLPSG